MAPPHSDTEILPAQIYPTSPLKRQRATKAEMEERAEFLIAYAEEHGPVTVRQLYYRAEVEGLPGIDKTESGYCKIQSQVLSLRREGRLEYEHIADTTRWMRKPRSFEITAKFDVPLMVSRGFASETFCYEAIAQRDGDDRPYHVYYLGDFDCSGRDAALSLEEKLTRFGEDDGIGVEFEQIAVTVEQIKTLGLPTRKPKRQSPADRNWPHDFACELDAIEPDILRELVDTAINRHVDQDQLRVLKVAEKSERELLKALGHGP